MAVKVGPFALPLIATSAVFFFFWGVVAVALASGGVFGSSVVVSALSIASLIGATQFLRIVKGESARWFWGLALAVVIALLVLRGGAAALIGIHPGQFETFLLVLLVPTAALFLYAFPERCSHAVRGPLAVTALVSIASVYLIYHRFVVFVADPVNPVVTGGLNEVIGILYPAYLMPLIGVLLVVTGAICR
jgi:hypothetical protein